MSLSGAYAGSSLARWVSASPAWWIVPVTVLGWGVLALHAAAPASWPLCLSRRSGIAWWQPALLGSWLVMVVAMMPALSAPLVGYVGMRSYSFRRVRAMTAFVAGLLAVWVVAGIAVMPLVADLPGLPLAAIGFAAAAAWQFAPVRQHAMRRCHRTRPLTPEGWAADRDCIAFGLARGADCLLVCGPMMVAATLAGHSLPIMLCLMAVALAERRAREPEAGQIAVVLGCLAIGQFQA